MEFVKKTSGEVFVPNKVEIELNIILENEQKGLIFGTIFHPDGSVIKGVPVQLYSIEDDNKHLEANVFSDSDGTYMFGIQNIDSQYEIKTSY